MKKFFNNCFETKKRSITLHQTEIEKHECDKIATTCETDTNGKIYFN